MRSVILCVNMGKLENGNYARHGPDEDGRRSLEVEREVGGEVDVDHRGERRNSEERLDLRGEVGGSCGLQRGEGAKRSAAARHHDAVRVAEGEKDSQREER